MMRKHQEAYHECDGTSGIYSLSSDFSHPNFSTPKTRWNKRPSMGDESELKTYRHKIFNMDENNEGVVEKDKFRDTYHMETDAPSSENSKTNSKDINLKNYDKISPTYDKIGSVDSEERHSIKLSHQSQLTRVSSWGSRQNGLTQLDESILSKIEKSNKNIEKLDMMYQKQYGELETVSIRLDDLKNDRQLKDGKIREMTKLIEELQKKNANLADELNDSDKMIENNLRKTKLLEEKLAETSKELDKTRFSFINYKEKTYEMIEDRESQILELKEELDGTKSLYNTKSSSKFKYSPDKSLLIKIQELEEANKELKQEVKMITLESSKKVKTLKKIIDVMSEKIEEKDNDSESSPSNKEGFQACYNEKMNILEVSNLRKTISYLNEQIESYKTKVDAIQQAYNQLNEEYESIKLNTENSSHYNYEQDVETCRNSDESYFRENEKLKTENTELKGTISELNKKMKSLQSKYDDIKQIYSNELLYKHKNDDNPKNIEASNPFLEAIETDSMSEMDCESLSRSEKDELLKSLILKKTYLKNVILKFITGNHQNSHVLMDLMSNLLGLKPREEKIFRECMNWKMPLKR